MCTVTSGCYHVMLLADSLIVRKTVNGLFDDLV